MNIASSSSASTCLSSDGPMIDATWNESNDQATHESVYEIYTSGGNNGTTGGSDDPLNLQGKQSTMINSIGSSNSVNESVNTLGNSNSGSGSSNSRSSSSSGSGSSGISNSNNGGRNQLDHHSHHAHHAHHQHHQHTRYSILRDADSTVVDYGYESSINNGVYPCRPNVNQRHSTVIHSTIVDGKRTHSTHLETLEIKNQPITPNRSSLRPHSTPATLFWLEENYEIAEGVCIPRSALYMHYVDFCARNCIQPVNAASFGKIIRQQFPQLTTRRLGTRGQSRYHYYGIAVRENSTYYQLAYSKKAITSNNLPDSSRLTDTVNGDKNCSNQGQMIVNNHSSTPPPTTSTCVNTVHPNHHHHNPHHVNHSNTNTNANGSNRNRVGTVLPDFPSPNDFKLPPNLDNIKTATFLMMYRTHCQRILDTVIRANFDDIQTFVLYFWQGIPPHLTSILTSNAFINLIGICDSILYKCMASVLLPSALQTFPDSLTQVIRKFTQEIECCLKMALYNLPDTLKSIKIDLSRHLSNLLRRQTSISHLIQAARMVVNNGDVTPQMICDWRSLSFDLITREAIQSSSNKTEPMNNTNNINFDFILTALRDFGRLLEDESPIEAYFDWLNALVQYCIINTSNNLRYNFKENSKQFLSTWSAFASRIIHELSLNSALSFGSFHLLRLLFDEYLLYIMEYCQIDEYIMELMANINHDLPPQPLEENYLGESSDDNRDNYQPTNGPDYVNETIVSTSASVTLEPEFRSNELNDVKTGHDFSRCNVLSSDYSSPAVEHYYHSQSHVMHNDGQLMHEESRKSFSSHCTGDYHDHGSTIPLNSENSYSRYGNVDIGENASLAIEETRIVTGESASISSQINEDINYTFCSTLKTEYSDYC